MLAQLTVLLDGVLHTMVAEESQTLLDAMDASGLEGPSSCREGSCGTCMCTLEVGQVELRQNNLLSQSDFDDGWTLACQAMPRSAEVRIRFPD